MPALPHPAVDRVDPGGELLVGALVRAVRAAGGDEDAVDALLEAVQVEGLREHDRVRGRDDDTCWAGTPCAPGPWRRSRVRAQERRDDEHPGGSLVRLDRRLVIVRLRARRPGRRPSVRASGAVLACGYFCAADEDAVVAVGRAGRRGTSWPTLADQAPMSVLVDRVARPDLEHGADRDGADALLGLEQRARAGAPRASTIFAAVMASSSVSVTMAVMAVSPSVDEAVGGRGDLGDEPSGGHDLGAVDEVDPAHDAAALEARDRRRAADRRAPGSRRGASRAAGSPAPRRCRRRPCARARRRRPGGR